MLLSLINILSIPPIGLLITILSISSVLRQFCGFLKINNKSQSSKFKLSFLGNFNNFFSN